MNEPEFRKERVWLVIRGETGKSSISGHFVSLENYLERNRESQGQSQENMDCTIHGI
jgi:hypothetical protein